MSTESSVARIAILGADTVLAATPATPVQLAHACHAVGYDMVFPASWGDELVAAHCLSKLGPLGSQPAVVAACPHVVDRLTRAGSELEPMLITSVAPPVAAARYLRAAFGERPVHITYLGSCPAATDAVIDERLQPEALLALLVEHGVDPNAQPEFFDSTLPPDRRRYWSQPGGAPTAEHVAAVDAQRTLVDVEGDGWLLDLAERLVARERVLIDLAPQLGCACSGACGPGAGRSARSAVVALEPPRAPYPILDPSVVIELEAPASSLARRTLHPVDESRPGSAGDPEGDEAAPATLPMPLQVRRAASVRPTLRTRDGVRVPRAFVAQRDRRTRRVRGTRRAPALPRRLARPGIGGADETHVPRSVVIELPPTPPSVLPPLPAKPRLGVVLGLETARGER